MNQVNREFLERYQKLWEADQDSRAFAPLAEAHRQEGNLLEALKVCRHGVHRHPHFAGGWFQLAKIHNDLKQIDKAREALKKAVQLAPENILAHKMLADIYLAEKQPKEVLKCLKMVLLLNPDDQRAKKIIQRLESLTADEYSADVFEINFDALFSEFDIQPKVFSKKEEFNEVSGNSFDAEIDGIFLQDQNKMNSSPKVKKENVFSRNQLNQERHHTKTVTLVDALLVRNEFEKAQRVIDHFAQKWGLTEELTNLLSVIESQKDKSTELESIDIAPSEAPREMHVKHLKLKKLETMLAGLERKKRA